MFLNNKYTQIYYRIIHNAQQRAHIKILHDGYQSHHIIPRCFGGTDCDSNLVILTYKEHRVCHRLLINMVSGASKHKMSYAYKLFNKHYDTSDLPTPQIYCTPESYSKMVKTRKSKGSYKRGKDNIFSTPKIIEQVRQRMIDSNPMKSPEQKERMRQKNNNPFCRPLTVDGIEFPSLGAAARYFNTTPFKIRKHYTIEERNPVVV
jgi:hypothetical protein